MDIFDAIILSIIEGVTEFLPISSTGHLIIASKFLAIPQTNFVKSFEISIQLGAILSVLSIYLNYLINNKKIIGKILLAFFPTAIIGFLLYGLIKNYLIGNFEITILSLFLGGIAIILIEKYFKKHQGKSEIISLSLKNSILIGIFQAISVIPGVSRSAATILSGMAVGLNRRAATEFSFLLAIPTMFAATSLDLIKNINSFEISQLNIMAIGFIASFLTAYLTVKWFINFVEKKNLISFGVYRIIFSLIFLVFAIAA